MPNGDKVTAARPMVAGERANKALHLTPVNVAKISGKFTLLPRSRARCCGRWAQVSLNVGTALRLFPGELLSNARPGVMPSPCYSMPRGLARSVVGEPVSGSRSVWMLEGLMLAGSAYFPFVRRSR